MSATFVRAADPTPQAQNLPQSVLLSADDVQDKIRGGLLGHLLGDLNGLKHEMKYIAEPGAVTEYTPSLPKGAWTDDDTDFEWVYIVAMQQRGVTLIPAQDIPALWKAHINRLFWCANQYARQLMDLGMAPPMTGYLAFNPWSDFNISGQFVSESWGLISPGMPRTAARIGLNYTHVAISGEPAQTTQLFDAMIATAFLTDDLEKILDAGMAAVDPKCVVRQVAGDVRAWHRQHPDDWRAARRLVKDKYTHHNGETRDRNGYELNTASVIGALLYGQGDYIKTSIAAFNFGWDADNNAATACTIVGVLKGGRWMMAQGWEIKDVYRNISRDDMPMNETLTSFGDRLIALAERVIAEQGGKKIAKDGKAYYQIQIEQPANIEPLTDTDTQFKQLRETMKSEIEEGIARATGDEQRARAAYQAICLDLAPQLREKYSNEWAKALEALNGYPKVVSVMFFESSTPAGEKLRQRAIEAGIKKLDKKVKIWSAILTR
ncbi:MAG: ADP-ribosylglycohydrolase family protein [Candidatus Sumerlaeota bacterium]|nr:ADP-ribosylglycohydrolase family protein [Candidatus Sumerlaeota bacterium]